LYCDVLFAFHGANLDGQFKESRLGEAALNEPNRTEV
jgi:hypothetical protein